MFWKERHSTIPTKEKPKLETTPKVKKKDRSEVLRESLAKVFQGVKPKVVATQDESSNAYSTTGITGLVPDDVLRWYSSQSFIGYQACMIMAQHWLVSAACEMPITDALRKKWKISGNEGEEITSDILSVLKEENKRVKIKDVAENFGIFGRVYGYRIAIFLIDGYTAEDYEAPFNPDGVKEGSYLGISQPDPYFVVPLVTSNDPASLDFYEPEFWQVSGIKYHKSHCVIYKHCDTVGQQLKPVYLYGSVPLPQQIYEQVYQALLGLGEGNKLLMTKRLWVQNGDIAAMIADQAETESRLEFITKNRDNHGVQLIDSDDVITQMETALSEVTSVIDQQFQIVAAIARVPVNKLMQNQLKGFAATGESEEAVYHESLETIQTKIEPLIEKHTFYSMLNKGVKPFNFDVVFNPLDSLTTKEQAEANQNNAAADEAYANMGVITPQEVRDKIISDDDSGYGGLSSEIEDDIDYPLGEI